MREIFFRGKRIDNGKWIEGYYWTNGIDNHFIKVIKDKSGNFVSNAINNNFEVESNTVGQYTGIEDANGKKIFEGDIVRCWGGEQCQGYHEFEEEITVNDMTYDAYYVGQWDGCLVIGNIHDNPELLKEELK